jgi:DNA-binding IscR family transcriptional regulator
VRKILKLLERKGLIVLRQGRHVGVGPIFNAANDAVEQVLSKTSLAELVRSVGKICLKL